MAIGILWLWLLEERQLVVRQRWSRAPGLVSDLACVQDIHTLCQCAGTKAAGL